MNSKDIIKILELYDEKLLRKHIEVLDKYSYEDALKVMYEIIRFYLEQNEVEIYD